MRSSLVGVAVAVAVAIAAGPRDGNAQRRPGRFPDMQQQMGGEYYSPPDWRGNPLYDGKVTFVRIKWRGYEKFTDEGPGWSHDYPISETHFMKIMREITAAHPFVQKGQMYGSKILAFDDPELFKYPVAYVSEPGGWHMNASELAGFRKYIQRGGFVIFDDMGFRVGESDLMNLQYEWGRAFPGAKILPVPQSHPVFDSFFKIDLTKVTAYYSRQQAQVYGVYEDNDPKKRLIAVINDMQDLGEYIEFSDRGFDVVPSNEAYKLLVNYFIYALTH